MAHVMRRLYRGYFVERCHHLVAASSRHFAHSSAESHETSTPEADGIFSSDSELAEVEALSIEATYPDSYKEWRDLDKVMTKHLDGAMNDVRRLFHLVKQNKIEEMLLVHDELAEKEKEAIHKSMDVVMYSRLMTRVRELGPQYVLPVFQRMLSHGVTPNVVPYTILVQSFMETVARENGKSSMVKATQEEYLTKALDLVKEMREKAIPPNKLTYKPIMAWLAQQGKLDQFQEVAKWMAEDEVPFDGVFKYYEIQVLLQSRNYNRAKALYLAAKGADQKLPSSLDD